MASPLAQFIIWLHDRALNEGRVPNIDAEGERFLAALNAGRSDYRDEVTLSALELHDGRPHSELARRVQRRAMSETHSLDVVLAHIDEAGYTTINIRALLSQHFWDLRYAALGSDANCAYIDLTTAINAASDRTRTVAWLLIAGLGPQEVGQLLSTNGSRKINRALAELTKILGGRHYAATN